MNPINDRLDRLLRAAGAEATPAESADSKPPFGFETRVLATLAATRASARNNVFDLVFRQALISAAAVLCVSIGLNYRALTSFGMALYHPDAQLVRLTEGTVNNDLGLAATLHE